MTVNKEKTLEELKRELIKKSDVIVETLFKLEKATLLLNHWSNEYGFFEEPDPWAAIKAGSTVGGSKDIHGNQSMQWYYEYKSIVQFINIAEDYVYESKEALRKAVYE